MKALVILLCAPLLFVVPARADETSKNAKVEELINVMHLEQMLPQTMQLMETQMRQTIANQLKQMNLPSDAATKFEEVQKKMMALIKDKMSWQNVKPIYLKAYVDTFTEEELEGVLNFYKSPAGQAFLKKTPLLTQNIMQATQGIMSDMMTGIMTEIPRIVEEFKQNR